MANVGTLTVLLEASQAKFIEDLGKASAAAEASAHRIERAFTSAFSGLSSIAGTLGVGLSIAGIVSWGESVVAAAEHLHNLSIETGSSVESLSRLSNIAKVSGTSFETFQTMIDRLAAGIGGAEGKSTRIGEALKLLGVNATDPAAALQEVADKLAKFSDGANKAALAKDLFGRSGVEFLSSLRAIAEQSGIAATRTREQADKATELAESYRQLTIQSNYLKDALLDGVAPALTEVVKAMSTATKVSGGFFAGLGQLAGISPFSAYHDQIVDANKEISKFQETINHPGFFGAGDSQKQIDMLQKRVQILKELQIQSIGLLDNVANYDARDIRARQLPPAPKLPAIATGALDDPSRKILEAALAALKANTEQEKAILANRDQYLSAVFARGNSTIVDYYAEKQAAQDEDLRRTSANYLEEIALINRFIDTAKTQKDKAQGEKEKVAATAREQLAIIQAAGKAQQTLDEQDKSLRDYGHTLDEVNAKVLDLEGNTAAAARIRFDNQNEIFRAGLKTAIESPTSTDAAVNAAKAARDRLDAIEKTTGAQAKLNDVQTKYTLIIDQISLAQGRIDLQQQTGQITELQGINAKAAAAQDRIAQLTGELAKYSAIANDPGLVAGPIKDSAILKVEQMRLEIDKLAAQSDVLAAKFRDIFSSSTATLIDDLIAHTKTAKQAGLDYLKSIETSISQIASKNIAESLFGKTGAAGGIPDLFAKWFGGGSSLPTAAGQVAGDAFLPGALGAGSGNWLTKLTDLFGGKGGAGEGAGVATLGTAATTTAGFLTAIDAPATALALSLSAAASAATMFSIAASAGGIQGAFMGSGAGGLGALIGPGGLFGFAEGTPSVPRTMLAVVHQGEKITPASQNRSGGASSGIQIVQHINVLPGATRASADQAAAAMGMEIRRATARVM